MKNIFFSATKEEEGKRNAMNTYSAFKCDAHFFLQGKEISRPTLYHVIDYILRMVVPYNPDNVLEVIKSLF